MATKPTQKVPVNRRGRPPKAVQLELAVAKTRGRPRKAPEPSTKIPACKVPARKVAARERREPRATAILSTLPVEVFAIRLHVGAILRDIALGRHKDAQGFAVWNTWCRRAAEYDESAQRETWGSFAPIVGDAVGALRYYEKRCADAEFPVHDSDIVEYAREVLSKRLKVADRTVYVFREGRWHADRKHAARALLEVINDLLVVARRARAADAVRELKKRTTFAAAEKMLKGFNAFSELDAMESDFDSRPELLGVPGGVVDLRTAEFRAATPEDMVSRATATIFNVKAKCPNFLRFLTQVAPSRAYQVFLQVVCGYLLVGHSNEHKAFFLYGNGRNGKGVLTRAIQTVMGDGYSTVLAPTFLKSAGKGNGNDPTPALMKLRGARVALVTETQGANGIDQPFFKALTGGDSVSGRHGHQEQESFKPQAKLLISTNEMPDWPCEDQALWERVNVLPFVRQFLGQDVNTRLDAELAAEAPGILQWMIGGAKLYIEQGGLGECPEVAEATRKARESADTVSMWIEAQCQRGPGLKVRAGEAREVYVAYCDRKRLDPLDTKKFSARLKALGFKDGRDGGGIIYRGLGLNR